VDDMVLLFSGPFLDTISNLMEGTLRKLNEWGKSCGLGVNQRATTSVFEYERITPSKNQINSTQSLSAYESGVMMYESFLRTRLYMFGLSTSTSV